MGKARLSGERKEQLKTVFRNEINLTTVCDNAYLNLRVMLAVWRWLS